MSTSGTIFGGVAIPSQKSKPFLATLLGGKDSAYLVSFKQTLTYTQPHLPQGKFQYQLHSR